MKFTKTLISASLLALPLFFVTDAHAAVRCETQYGGGQVCVKTGQLQVDKKAWHPTDKKFVDHISSSYKFSPGSEITFKLAIKNVGDENFSKVSVTDTLPAGLELVSGQLNFDITDLAPGETEEREIKARVASSIGGMFGCIDNVVEAFSGDSRDRDTSNVCWERQATVTKELPKAGPENWFIVLALSLLAGTTGAYLKKFSRV